MSREAEILNRLSAAMGDKTQSSNEALAGEIISQDDETAVQVLIEALELTKQVQNDAIKVIYEVAAVKPELLEENAGKILALLPTKNNRLGWGLLKTIYHITEQQPDEVFAALPVIQEAAESGSVIAKDNYNRILLSLARAGFSTRSKLISFLEDAALNQLPMYVEESLAYQDQDFYADLKKLVSRRIQEYPANAKRKRLEKALLKLKEGV
jgi:hypothetical protein